MASVVLVMAALAIDLTTLYTARSEAQLAADGAALAGARVLANSGMTSSDGTNPLTPPFDTAGAESLAQSVAVQVASSNQIGGKAISGAGTCGSTGISVCFNDADVSNPRVTVQVTRPDLPTFFLRFWSKQLAVTASATAEAYNPAGLSTRRTPAAPVAPICVKPWLLPNIDPTQGAGSTNWAAIFDRRSGTIENGNLTGEGWQNTNPSPNTNGLLSQSPGPPYTARPTPGEYYPVVIDPSGTSNPGTSLRQLRACLPVVMASPTTSLPWQAALLSQLPVEETRTSTSIPVPTRPRTGIATRTQWRPPSALFTTTACRETPIV